MNRLIKAGWSKNIISEWQEYYTHPDLKNFKGELCEYDLHEALTIQNGWDIK